MTADSTNKHCLDCGYNLRGLKRGTCPECGRWFDPDDTQTWSRQVPDGRMLQSAKKIGRVVDPILHIGSLIIVGLFVFVFLMVMIAPDVVRQILGFFGFPG